MTKTDKQINALALAVQVMECSGDQSDEVSEAMDILLELKESLCTKSKKTTAKKTNLLTVKKYISKHIQTAEWICPTTNSEYVNKEFFANCSKCGHTAGSTEIPFVCPDCKSVMADSIPALRKLNNAFPNSFINSSGEFVACDGMGNQSFRLDDCKTEDDIKRKVIAWFSRGDFKTTPFASETKNQMFNDMMLDGINQYLGTCFTKDDVEIVYTYLGNAVNSALMDKFIENKYDIQILKQTNLLKVNHFDMQDT